MRNILRSSGHLSKTLDWRGALEGHFRDKSQLEAVDDSVHHGIVGNKSDDIHRAVAWGTDQRVDFI